MNRILLILMLLGISSCKIFQCGNSNTTNPQVQTPINDQSSTNSSPTTETQTTTGSNSGTTSTWESDIWKTYATSESSKIKVEKQMSSLGFEAIYEGYFIRADIKTTRNDDGSITTNVFSRDGVRMKMHLDISNNQVIISGTFEEVTEDLYETTSTWKTITKGNSRYGTIGWRKMYKIARSIQNGKITYN